MGIDVERETQREWLEADGLGGYASGTVSGIRTRRYHGLLMVARRPPAERTLLVAGLEAWIERGAERMALSSQRYDPGVVHPDGAARIARFEREPWPRWTYAIDGGEIVHELFAPHGRPATALSWTTSERARLCVRLLLAARDFHGLQRENGALRPDPSIVRGRLCFRIYEGAPSLAIASDADYAHAPSWYRSFLYDRERERGLDAIEDLWSPGTLSWELAPGGRATMILSARELDPELASDPRAPAAIHDALASGERARRSTGTSLDRAAAQYVVARGAGKTIIAGYPWFGDWGRDTFLSMRGVCTERDALAILRGWARFVDRGTLPNRFPDVGEEPEHNSVDAALWYVVAAGELDGARGDRAIEGAIDAIVRGYREGTRHGIRADRDGLLAAGEPGQQLTWMDARVDGREVTPRIGKPVEINALWLNALAVAARRDPSLEALSALGTRSFRERFVLPERGHLADVVDDGHVPGAIDARLRPNQILAVGGLPIAIVEGAIARSIVDLVERELWTPMGLRTLARGEPGYAPRYEGGPRERDGQYHQGTVWPWLVGAFVDAWVRVRGGTVEARREARARFVAPLLAHTEEHGLGHVCEIADAEPPHAPRGCPFQAWSVGELRRARALTEP